MLIIIQFLFLMTYDIKVSATSQWGVFLPLEVTSNFQQAAVSTKNQSKINDPINEF